MQLPKNELIAEHVRETVAGVQLSVGGTKDLVVRRFSHIPEQMIPHDGLAVIVALDPMRDPDAPIGFIQWNQEFAIIVFLFEHEQSVVHLETRANCIRADIERAVMMEPTRGGYALDTRIEAPDYSLAENEPSVTVNISVRYRTLETDPYQ